MLTERQQKLLDEVKVRLYGPCEGVRYPSADAYYQDKDLCRELEAASQGKTQRQTDPMGYWYGRQSN